MNTFNALLVDNGPKLRPPTATRSPPAPRTKLGVTDVTTGASKEKRVVAALLKAFPAATRTARFAPTPWPTVHLMSSWSHVMMSHHTPGPPPSASAGSCVPPSGASPMRTAHSRVPSDPRGLEPSDSERASAHAAGPKFEPATVRMAPPCVDARRSSGRCPLALRGTEESTVLMIGASYEKRRFPWSRTLPIFTDTLRFFPTHGGTSA